MRTAYAVLAPELLKAFEASFEFCITGTHSVVWCFDLSLAQNTAFWLNYLVACHVVYMTFTQVVLGGGSWVIAFYHGTHGDTLERSSGNQEAHQ